MANPKALRKQRVPPISAAAAQEIGDRIAEARPRVLEDFGRITSSRSGSLTPPQVAQVAAVLSHLMPPGSCIRDELAEWLRGNGADPALATAWATTDEGSRVQEGYDTRPDVRRDLARGALRVIFDAVDDSRAESLGLAQLVSERLRSRARRRAEGVEPRQAQGQPWLAAGVSRPTWYRIRAEAAARETLATVKDKEETTATASRARIRSRESHPPVSPDDAAAYVVPAPPPPPPWTPPALRSLPTAEGRRYARAALAAGARWRQPHSPEARDDPRAWFDLPDLPALTATYLEQARQAAVSARTRANRIAAAKQRRNPAPPYVLPDAQQCPAKVSEETWLTVPPELREAVRTQAGRLFLAGHAPDSATMIALDAVRRQASRAARMAAALPDAPTEEVAHEARARWQEPLDAAVQAGVEAIKARYLNGSPGTPSQEALARARELASRANPPYPASYAEDAITALAEALAAPEGRSEMPFLLAERARHAGYLRMLARAELVRSRTTKTSQIAQPT